MNGRGAAPVYSRNERTGDVGLVLVLAMGLIGAVSAYFFMPSVVTPKIAMVLFGACALAGVFFLFGAATGIIQFRGRQSREDVATRIPATSSRGMLVTDADQRIIYANATYMGFCGARDASGVQTVERLFAGSSDVSEAVYRIAQAARAHRAHVEDIRLSPSLSESGGVGWYRLRVRPLDLPGGGVGALWTVADSTLDRKGQENVFQELQHAINFLDHAPAGFFSANPRGAISYMNSTLANWLDYDLTQVGTGGVSLSDIVANNGSALLIDVVGNPGEVRTEQIDLDFKRRDGRSLPVRILHRVAFGQDGTPGDSRTLVLNRTAGETPGEDLRAAEVRFARFFNSTPMAIAMVDAEGRVIRSNAAFARLAPQAVKAGHTNAAQSWTILSGVVERDRPILRAAIEAALDNEGDVKPVDAALEGADGSVASSARFFASPSEDEGKRGALIYALDTTEQRKLQEEFAQSQKMQAVGQLAGGVAHDFNNMLTAIIGYCDLLLANHRPTDPSFQDIMQIKQTANRAASLTRQLLAFSRRQTLRPQVLQLNDVLPELQLWLRRLVGEKIEVDLKHGRDLWFVKVDINQFEQVVMNLVVNARDAMPDSGGKVQLRTKNVNAPDCASYNEASLTAGEYVLVEVEDNGGGIPPEVIEKIFEPFFTTKDVGKGTGLGLSTVFGIVKQSGGFIFVESQVGKGATFRIFLPRYIPDEKELEPKVEETKPAADYTGQGIILLVEDEDNVRSFGARALTSRGYTVLEAATGLEALEVVEREGGKIDLIISDVVMPEMDGPAMFAELRKRGVKAKVIFVSGYAEEAFEKNLPEGEFGFLPKPFTLKQLIETVKQNVG